MDPPFADVSGPHLRVATYNVHGCVGTDRRRSETRIAEVIASLQADVVGLQELDAGRPRSGGINQAQTIAERLGWNWLFQPAVRNANEHYGIALISRYPLRFYRVVELPGCGTWYCRETRVALWAEVETALGSLYIVNTHFGLGRGERLQQTEALRDLRADVPLVLLGDFNSLPGGLVHRRLTSRLHDTRRFSSSSPRTFPTRLPLLAVDHIFINDALQTTNLRACRSSLTQSASDHYPLVADLVRAAGKPAASS